MLVQQFQFTNDNFINFHLSTVISTPQLFLHNELLLKNNYVLIENNDYFKPWFQHQEISMKMKRKVWKNALQMKTAKHGTTYINLQVKQLMQQKNNNE